MHAYSYTRLAFPREFPMVFPPIEIPQEEFCNLWFVLGIFEMLQEKFKIDCVGIYSPLHAHILM